MVNFYSHILFLPELQNITIIVQSFRLADASLYFDATIFLRIIASLALVSLILVFFRMRLKNWAVALKRFFNQVFSNSGNPKNSEAELSLHKYSMDNASHCVVWIDCNGNITYLNKKARSITSHIAKNQQELKIWDINAGLTQETWDETWQFIKNNGPHIFEGCMVNPRNSETTYFEFTYNYILYHSQELIIGYWQDITERKFAELALFESEERYRTLVDQSPNPIAIITKGRYKFMNGSAIKAFGFRELNEVVGMDVLDVIHPDSQHIIKELLKNTQQGTHNHPVEIKLLKHNGLVSYILCSSILIRLSGEPATLIVGHDITDLKRMQDVVRESEELLKQQNEEYLSVNEELLQSSQQIQQINLELLKAKDHAEESDRLKSAFLANLSHEIRTPMNGILGFSELLMKPGMHPDKVQQYSQIINNSCHQLLNIINDIVDISKIESGQVKLHLAPTNINQIIDETSILFENLAHEKEINISTSKELNNHKCTIVTDGTRIRQVLSNLLNNAIKFTAAGTIRLGYSMVGETVEFYVSDTGIGIAPEHHAIIFERFRQIEDKDFAKVSGTGLGLPISKALIELLGGKIWVTSDSGSGSTFTFSIPYKPANPFKTKTNKAPNDLKGYNWCQKNILIAEDDDFNFIFIDELLSVTYANLFRVANGAEAIEFCRNHPETDVVIMDLKLPVIDGLAATKTIKQIRPGLPIILQTSDALSGERDNAFLAGCDDYISKPIDQNDLLRKIEKQLSGKTIAV